jgi:hypothetical protein
MRYKILLLGFLLLSMVTYAQTGVKVYGFYQEQSPGTVAVDPVTNQEIKPDLPKIYQLYLSVPKGAKIQVREVWVEGKRMSARPERTSTPVLFTSPGTGQKETLISKTASAVYRLETSDPTTKVANARGKSLSAANQLVIVYTLNGTLRYASLKSLKRLEPVMYM